MWSNQKEHPQRNPNAALETDINPGNRESPTWLLLLSYPPDYEVEVELGGATYLFATVAAGYMLWACTTLPECEDLDPASRVEDSLTNLLSRALEDFSKSKGEYLDEDQSFRVVFTTYDLALVCMASCLAWQDREIVAKIGFDLVGFTETEEPLTTEEYGDVFEALCETFDEVVENLCLLDQESAVLEGELGN